MLYFIFYIFYNFSKTCKSSNHTNYRKTEQNIFYHILLSSLINANLNSRQHVDGYCRNMVVGIKHFCMMDA